MSDRPRSSLDYLAPQRPVRSDFARQQRGLSYAARRIITLGILAVIVAAGAVWGWGHVSTSTPGEIPTVKAEGPVKQRPDQPGGVDIPNQDMQVYHEIDSEPSGKEKPVVEHMLPPPETPNLKEGETPNGTTFFQDPNQLGAEKRVEDIKASDTTVSQSDPILDTPPISIPTTVTPRVVKPVERVMAPQPVPVQAEVAPQPPMPTVVPVPSVVSPQPVASVPAPVPTVSVVAPAPAAPVNKGGTIIQLAATQDAHAADALVQTLQKKYGKTLGAAHLHSVKADLGVKGIFYRIQSQPLSMAEANSICGAIKQQSAGCLLVRP